MKMLACLALVVAVAGCSNNITFPMRPDGGAPPSASADSGIAVADPDASMAKGPPPVDAAVESDAPLSDAVIDAARTAVHVRCACSGWSSPPPDYCVAIDCGSPAAGRYCQNLCNGSGQVTACGAPCL